MNNDPFRDNELSQLIRERNELKAASEAHASELDEHRHAAAVAAQELRDHIVTIREMREELKETKIALSSRTRSKYRENLALTIMWVGGLALIVTLAVWLCSAIASCNDAENMEAGFIVSRDYDPPYTTTVCTNTTKTSSCHPVHHPERYSLTLADGEHEERTIDLDEEAWRRRSPGEWMCIERTPCIHPHDDAADHQ